MRAIKFRGKSRIDGRWVHGDLIHLVKGDKMGYFIAHSESNGEYVPHEEGKPDVGYALGEDIFPVEIDSIGQFTGLHDKTGKGIWEDDILTTDVVIGGVFKEFGIVKFLDGGFVYAMYQKEDGKWVYTHIDDRMRVIGNIHDKNESYGE